MFLFASQSNWKKCDDKFVYFLRTLFSASETNENKLKTKQCIEQPKIKAKKMRLLMNKLRNKVNWIKLHKTVWTHLRSSPVHFHSSLQAQTHSNTHAHTFWTYLMMNALSPLFNSLWNTKTEHQKFQPKKVSALELHWDIMSTKNRHFSLCNQVF